MEESFMLAMARLAIVIPSFLISLSFHECAHALAATVLGDDTPRRTHRLTLNPLRHIDPIGLFFLVLFGIGWAKPVLFDYRNFRCPRIYSIITAFAGPLSNFTLALCCLYIIKYAQLTIISSWTALFFNTLAHVNIMLGVFNLLPIPPLDGSHLLIALLIKQFPEAVMWIYRYSMFILIALFLIPQSRILLLNLITQAKYYLAMLVF